MTTAVRAIEWQSWALQDEADERFRRACLQLGLPTLALCLIIPFLHFAAPEPAGDGETRYAELLADAPPAPEIEEPEPEAEPTPEPEPKPKPKPKPELTETQKIERARTKASQLLSSVSSELASLNTLSPTPNADRILTSGVKSGPAAATNLEAAESSGGIGDTSTVERSESDIGLGERKTTRVQSGIGSGAAARGGRQGSKRTAGRSLEEIRIVLDRHQGGFYALYQRFLREFPDAQGVIRLRVTIAPSGAVTACTIISSDLNNPDFERKVVNRMKLINFGSKDVPPETHDIPIRFFPQN